MPDRRPFLSAAALEITPAEHKAAIEIRGLLAADKFHHDPDVDVDKPNGFNMNVSLEEGECGTTGCVGGWMFLVMQRDRTLPANCYRAHDYITKYRSRALSPLFYPFTNRNFRDLLDQHGEAYDFPFDLLPPAYAATAIDNFLTTGDPNWPEVTGLLNIEVEHA